MLIYKHEIITYTSWREIKKSCGRKIWRNFDEKNPIQWAKWLLATGIGIGLGGVGYDVRHINFQNQIKI